MEHMRELGCSPAVNSGRGLEDSDVVRLHETRDDPDEWDDAPAPLRVRPVTTNVVSFRMSHDELDGLQSIVRARGESVSEFVRDSIRIRMNSVSVLDPEDGHHAFPAAAETAELEVIARIDGVEISEVIRKALVSHVAARRRDPAFQERLRREQALLSALVE